MAFGVKLKTVKTQNSYTIESFYDAIKDKEFSAGKPSLTKHGMATIITFPALDRRNQVQILKTGFKAESSKFSVQKAEEAGVKNMATNVALDGLTKGWAGIGGVVSKNQKQCEKLVEETTKQLEELGL